MHHSRAEDSFHAAHDNTNTDIKTSPSEGQTSSNFSSHTRVACDACRDRKIRCNRHRPICGRCVRLGITCRYSSRSQSAPSKLDLSRILMTINTRLQQAETQIALCAITLNLPPLTTQCGANIELPPNPISPMQLATSSTDPYDLDIISKSIFTNRTMTEWSEQTNFDSPDFQFDAFASEIAVDPVESMLPKLEINGTQGTHTNSMFVNNIPSSLNQTTPELSTALLQTLRDICFEIYRPILAMIDHARFEEEVSQPSPSIEAQALSYALGALGALSVPELRCYVEKCYQQGRTLLDICERQDSSESLTSINTIQACTLLAIYELKQPNLGRAWMTLGRAIRLAKMMGLDQANGYPSIAAKWSPSTQPLTFFSPAKTEERRRTFWVLYILDTFATSSAKSPISFNEDIDVSLPGPEALILDFVKTGATMKSLSQILDSNLSEKMPLSSFAGMAIMAHLYQRCSNHIKSSSHSQSQSFWGTHYRIIKAIDTCRSSLLVEHLTSNSLEDPFSLVLRMSVDTVEIILYECAFLKVHKDGLTNVLVTNIISKCASAAIDICHSLQIGERLTGRKLESFQQLSNFHACPIATAFRICCRMLLYGCDHMLPYIQAIQILSNSTTTRFLIQQQFIALEVVEKANALAIAAESQSTTTIQT